LIGISSNAIKAATSTDLVTYLHYRDYSCSVYMSLPAEDSQRGRERCTVAKKEQARSDRWRVDAKIEVHL